MVDTASGCRGLTKYVNGKHTVVPVPEEFKDFYVPIPWQGRNLPVGAYTSLWPRSDGRDWVKVKPEGFDKNWRPQLK